MPNPGDDSEQFKRDGNLVTGDDPRLAPYLGFHRQEVAATIQRKDGCSPRDVPNRCFDSNGPETAWIAESMSSNLR